MSRLIIKDGKQVVIKTTKNCEINKGVFVGNEHLFIVLPKTLFMSDKLREATENLIKAIENERGE
jgi:hypothetical protein